MRGSDFAELRALSGIVRAGNFKAGQASCACRARQSARQPTIWRTGWPSFCSTARFGASRAPRGGATLLRGFDPAAAEIEAAASAAQQAGGRVAGRLAIRAQRLAHETIFAPALRASLDAYPDVVLDVKIDDARSKS